MQITYKTIVLRDMLESDIADYVRWFTTQTQWALWDAPWEQEDTDACAAREQWTRYYDSTKDLPDGERRWRLEIEAEGKHVGWVTSYLMNKQYEWIAADSGKEGQTAFLAVGIDICEDGVWGKGVGTCAMQAFIRYLFGWGFGALYTQTWSGNERMVRLASKLGFTACSRYTGIREVGGRHYDALTFKLENPEHAERN